MILLFNVFFTNSVDFDTNFDKDLVEENAFQLGVLENYT